MHHFKKKKKRLALELARYEYGKLLVLHWIFVTAQTCLPLTLGFLAVPMYGVDYGGLPDIGATDDKKVG